jgi:putative cell wall-binding protein
MIKAKRALASLAIVGVALTITPLNAFADTGVTTARLFGSDRVGTAIAVADAGWTTADTVILAPSDDADLVDALLAAPLAGKTSPILLTDPNTLTGCYSSRNNKAWCKERLCCWQYQPKCSRSSKCNWWHECYTT